MKQFLIWSVGTLLLLLVLGPFIRVNGGRLVGYRYGVHVNNASTICPDVVAMQTGNTVTLTDGRTFTVDHDAEDLAFELDQSECAVFVDTAEGVLYKRFRIGYCGFAKPQRSQLVTIPLFRVDLRSHGRQVLAPIKPTKVQVAAH